MEDQSHSEKKIVENQFFIRYVPAFQVQWPATLYQMPIYVMPAIDGFRQNHSLVVAQAQPTVREIGELQVEVLPNIKIEDANDENKKTSVSEPEKSKDSQVSSESSNSESRNSNEDCELGSEYMPDTYDKRKKHKKGKGLLWTQKEILELIKYYNLHKGKWKKVVEHLPGRNESQCSQKFRKVMKNKKVLRKKNRWTEEEDQKLREAYNLFGRNWVRIANDLPGRNSKQVRERFINNLDPSISNQPWTEEDDAKLIGLFNVYGKQWSKIATHFKDRSQNQIKNRQHYFVKQTSTLQGLP